MTLVLRVIPLSSSPSLLTRLVEASRLLKKWCLPNGFLERHGAGNGFFYILRKGG